MDFTIQNDTQLKRPKVAVVLSSGGARALAALPLFDFLEANQIEVDLLVGASGGGIVSALKALFSTNDILISELSKFLDFLQVGGLDYRSLLSLANLPFGHFDISKGMLKKEKILLAIEKFLGDQRLEDLTPKTIFQTTDILTGNGVILEEGRLVETLYATGCIYPILPPIEIEGQWLIDGAFSAPLPILEAYKRDADIIIAMYFVNNHGSFPNNFFKAFNRTSDIVINAAIKSQITLAINMHHFEIIPIKVFCQEQVGLQEIEKIPQLISWGAEALEAQKEPILMAVEHFQQGR